MGGAAHPFMEYSMNFYSWEKLFTHLLKQKLGITPADIHFRWSACYSQDKTPDEAIAFLVRTHALYPELKILPQETRATAKAKAGAK
jgi:hypothetical protein